MFNKAECLKLKGVLRGQCTFDDVAAAAAAVGLDLVL